MEQGWTYPKIHSPWKREQPSGRFIPEWSQPEFRYLAECEWLWHEKIDGTNIRVRWDGNVVDIRGRTDAAQLHPDLDEFLKSHFTELRMRDSNMTECILYGEGIGPKIQAAGRLYRPESHDFVLFDVRIGRFWLKPEAVAEIAVGLELQWAPLVGCGTLSEAVEMVAAGFDSTISEIPQRAEGLVLRPAVRLHTAAGGRVITKLKAKDVYDNVMEILP